MSLQPLSELPKHALTIKRALLSVSDKTGILPLARALHEADIEIISTGGTGQEIREAGIPVTDVSEVTGFEECLDGRVKTLHPIIHGGILGRTSHQPDIEEMERLDIAPIELVVVNLYPFKEAISTADCTPAIATENIDIGGPTMIRAAAKNFAHVCILTSPRQYEEFCSELTEKGEITFDKRQQWARAAFNHTAAYDATIANYFNELGEKKEALPEQLNISLTKSQSLRYGENPHQKAAVYGNQSEFIDCFHGKQLSYNNFLDVDSALNLIADFQDSKPTCAIFKHTVPCGVATDDQLCRAWDKAFRTDTKSPFGGIVVVNKELNLETA
ncbi:MAG: bifunctional phosphoribosylaminoimidazolecarboxamide formyltransferase/IMP cyclohydrolase, partial [Balneolaceae bacterium]